VRAVALLGAAVMLAACGPHQASEFSVASSAGLQTGTLPTLDEVWSVDAWLPLIPLRIHATADAAWAVLQFQPDAGPLRRIDLIRRDVVLATVELPGEAGLRDCACTSVSECWCVDGESGGRLVQFRDGRQRQQVALEPRGWRAVRARDGLLLGVNLLDGLLCSLDVATLGQACVALPTRLWSGLEVGGTAALLTALDGAWLVTARAGQPPVLERVLDQPVVSAGAQGTLFAVGLLERGATGVRPASAVLDDRGATVNRWTGVYSANDTALHAVCPVGRDALVGLSNTSDVVLLDAGGSHAVRYPWGVSSEEASIACR